ncbi:GNAT family N-acetyltransferase [Bacillus salipaludis]|uniref:GNAT family N-acetyltransferase n=1 Tax=Bacillus salipaludis TaxID=2547811 RepID=A0A4R5VQW5_9BACI|nr:GNAT family N-acetyltransferase [Bacillus salipaludis]MDQ6598697.1 GNAT family N-acetyltransferase [Bacillus salipaludis]TDK60759.1 GNAT family N-acetyltransferase [Bacillus salipaludis]
MIDQIVIKELLEEEKEAVRQLLVESYQQYKYEYNNARVWEEYLTNIKASVDNPEVEKILIAKSNDNILGTLQLFLSSEKAYQRPELQIFSPIIRLLAVHPEARGRGIAQELLKAGLQFAKSQGANKLYLHTGDKMQKAIRLYKWFGFKRDQTKEFYNNDILVKCYRYDL